ncbi:hypothetical protein AB0F81_20155 [Actinoplanes sp. NPDC024001]|uniref:hypothetical protein n=1 Tax=Actinoplanes sp. NPDC024001 TaxID=3154598 RepID=UPI00340CE8FA
MPISTPGCGRSDHQCSASFSAAEPPRLRCSVLPVMTRSPVRTFIHSKTTCAASSPTTNLSMTAAEPPTVLRLPGSTTENSSFSSTLFPPPFSSSSRL